MIKFCKRCQCETEKYASGNCKICSRASGRAYRSTSPDKARVTAGAWRTTNKDKIKAASAIYRTANADKIRSYQTTYCAANKENAKVTKAAYRAIPANLAKHRADAIAWYAANPEKAAARGAAWQKANPDKVKAYNAVWKKANPEAKRINDHNRRARKRANGGVLSRGLSAKLFELQRGKCACCKQPLGDNYHLDHILPTALGGPNIDSNMQLLTATCNMQKGAKHPDDFMKTRGFLL